MYEVFQPIAYNKFIKKERKDRGYSTKELSLKIPLSVGTINNIENSNNILDKVNLKYLLKEYGYYDTFLLDFDKKINTFMERFIHNVIFANFSEVDSYFNQIKELFNNHYHYQNILYTPYSLCCLIYTMLYAKPSDIDNINFLINHIHLFTDKYQSIANIYLGKYYELKRDYTTSKAFFDKALFNINKDDTYEVMYHYFISNLYLAQNEITKFYNHIETATILFGKERNYQRILNIDIKMGTHYMYLGKYYKSIDILLKALNQAEKYQYSFEKYIILHNLAFVYMILAEYEKAADCYRKFPKEEITQQHCHYFMISLYNINQIKEAIEISDYGVDLDDDSYYLEFFKIYQTSKDLNCITKGIEKVLKKLQNPAIGLEYQLLHRLLAFYYHKLGKYKKESEHLSKFIYYVIEV